ncbi:putative non-specific serine/threonine protein kinase [Helianthus annuus]|uniref:Non-specific serine/threonine protein kinase n=1 Tax=Helianthus annuus TaxID=4232 RepID=A0A251UWM7_HELAN|nr:receptor-like protein 14 isoform X1 [Helianthus annuus]KAF5808155.1 putative non-specific serine/threonine protein kinase [Helianthus annuus]KAJ0595340.1 putative non-specific serine/threonine protein kinase [Helianthus annuus]KAJ0924915.1 putative non-specific serine/threonine protein kinase [Helianthus annuus]
MESWCLSKHKASLLMYMLLLFSMVGWIQGIHIEDQRKALLDIKASLHELSNLLDVDNILPTWVDHGSTEGEYCEWERVRCDKTSGYVTDLSLSNIASLEDDLYLNYENNLYKGVIWPLNVSLFLHFKELKKLDLSWSYIGDTFISSGLERLSGLKKLENLNLSNNYIDSNYLDTNIFPSLSELTSLKSLDVSFINGYQHSPTHDISDFSTLENLEVLDLTGCGFYGTLQMSESAPTLRKLKVLNLGKNQFNESILKSLSALTSLKALDLRSNNLLSGLFPSEEISHFTNLEKLDLSDNNLDGVSSIQGCKSLMRLQNLESISLGTNYFNKSIISCLSFLPSLKILDLSGSSELIIDSFPLRELSSLRELTRLDLSNCNLESLTLNGTMSKLTHLNLDNNRFNDDIMRSMAAFPSLRYLSLGYCFLGGRLYGNELPDLPDLEVLILKENNFSGTLPIEALASFHHLEVLDLSSNNFVGSLSSTIKSLSSLKVLSFAYNKLNGSLPDDGFCGLLNLQELDLQENMFNGNIPECFNTLSSLKMFDISSNLFTGTLSPSLMANLTSLQYVDFSYNKFEGPFSFSSFSNHTKLKVVKFISDNDMFEIETEDPTGWIPMFQLKVLVLSNCNINRAKGNVFPSFLVKQRNLRVLDMSHNSMKGQLPNWVIKHNPMLEVLILRNNLFYGTIMLFRTNHNIRLFDLSGNLLTGVVPKFLQRFLPGISHLDLSSNSLDGVIPSSIGDMSELNVLDLSNNKLSGEVPSGLIANNSRLLYTVKLSNNKLHGEVLSGNFSLDGIWNLHLDNNNFTGNIGNLAVTGSLGLLDISNNFFTGLIPSWISNVSIISELVLRNNSLEGPFPCGTTSFTFLDISENLLSGPIPSCLNTRRLEHLHLGSNSFTGPIPDSFRNMTKVLTLDISNNYLSGEIPSFFGKLSNLIILLLRENNLMGSIPKQLCQLTNVSLLDLSNNSLSGSIPSCLHNITGPSYQAFVQESTALSHAPSFYSYRGFITKMQDTDDNQFYSQQDEVQFTTKSLHLTYKGVILDIMSGLDLSCNKLTGEIPEELGLLTQIRVLNLSHNVLTGPIPVKLSNLTNIESLDLSSNHLTGKVPPELTKLNSLSSFNISFNNLSGKLPEMTAQFSTFTKESYEGNALLCGLPLENKCTTDPERTYPSNNEEGTHEKWYNVDMVSFYGSCGSTWLVFMSGFAALLYINPYWRRKWLDFVEEIMFTCYYFLLDSVRRPFVLLHNYDL